MDTPDSLYAPVTTAAAPDYDVIVVGAGPVGLTLAALLDREGFRVLVLEKRTARSALSRAIGITPPSLRILATLGLDRPCIEAGLRIQDAIVHGNDRVIGDLQFHGIPGDYPFILSLPQSDFEAILEDHVTRHTRVTLRRGHAATAVETEKGTALVRCADPACPAARAPWVVACDGAASDMRGMAGIGCEIHPYPCRFAMTDFVDRSPHGAVAQLYFSRRGTVESFPLPGGKRRWIAQLIGDRSPEAEVSSEINLASIHERTGWAPDDRDRLDGWSAFQPQWLLADRFFSGRTILCGDAAHVMSPIGGQGMNTGLADAEDLAGRLRRILREGAAPDAEFRTYESRRRLAFRRAGRFAAICMWIGTRRGAFSARLRDWAIDRCLRIPPIRPWLARNFAMLPPPAASGPPSARESSAEDRTQPC